MRKLGPNIGSCPARNTGSSALHIPQCMTTSSPTFTWRTALPTFHTTPEASLPPMWNGFWSGKYGSFCRALMTSTGLPSDAQTLL
jgi:hypothetical protein